MKGFVGTIVPGKAVPEILDVKYRWEFKYAFTNSGCLHSPILKALPNFQEKTAHKSSDMQFFLQNVQNEIFKVFKMFKKT